MSLRIFKRFLKSGMIVWTGISYGNEKPNDDDDDVVDIHQ